jgi:cobalt-zinc-cadmium efflux system membrane fusion protein
MKGSRASAILRICGFIILAFALVGISAAAMPLVKNWWTPATGEGLSESPSSAPAQTDLVATDTLRLPADTIRLLGVQTAEVQQATHSRPLEMFGQFAPNTDRLFRIRARFPGHVAEIAEVASPRRPLQVGDQVQKGQLLAIIWSRDLGEKKSELVDGLSQLRLDEELHEQLRQAYNTGSAALRSVLEQERRVEAGRIAVARAERTLRSWEIGEAEIAALKQEAERLRQRGTIRDPEQYKRWARWEMLAPFSGTIVEKNASLNEYVDTTSLPLFQLADFSRLTVWAYPYEEDLPLLQALPRPVAWTIRLKSDPQAPALQGTIDLILPIIEPNQRTPILRGSVENPSGRLLSNQSLSATVELPAPPGEVIIPTTALVEDGQDSIVFVQPDPARSEFTMRPVSVVRRNHDVVYVRSRRLPTNRPEAKALQPGERVVRTGAVQMKAALEDLQARTSEER